MFYIYSIYKERSLRLTRPVAEKHKEMDTYLRHKFFFADGYRQIVWDENRGIFPWYKNL